MRRISHWIFSAVAVACSLCAGSALAQRHSFGSSPPTAPPPRSATTTVAPVSSGMGPLQFIAVNYSVPAPQALTRQLRADDERTRAAALSAVGAPGQYLQRGHIVMPHSVQLEFVALGNTDDLDALLTVELDQHLVTAVLLPDDGNWRRIASVVYATSYEDPRTSPATFVHTARSMLQRERYRAVFRGASVGPNEDFVENEANLRIFNNRAVITISFAAASRECSLNGQPQPGKPPVFSGCNVMHRWIQSDPTDPTRHFFLVTATGKLNRGEAASRLLSSRDYVLEHARNYTCQPLIFSETSLRFEPTATAAPCPAR